DEMLLHLEVGDAVTQQPAGLGMLLINVDIVADAGELLRTGEAAGPDPTTATVLPLLRDGGSGFTQPCSKARSTMAHSMVLMVTGSSRMLSVHEASHGAGQTRPVNSGKLLVECRLRDASSHAPV